MFALMPVAGCISNQEIEVMDSVPRLSVIDLSLVTPDGTRQLFANVSFDVTAGDHLLIMGSSGSGKSSMLRAIAGLWGRGAGEVRRPSTNDTVFLPQRPYCTLGSLQQQLIYPSTIEAWRGAGGDEEDLLEALRRVQLHRLADGGIDALNTVRDWGDELSLGEQQRLGTNLQIIM